VKKEKEKGGEREEAITGMKNGRTREAYGVLPQFEKPLLQLELLKLYSLNRSKFWLQNSLCNRTWQGHWRPPSHMLVGV
jgi:hypothetical protein